MKTTENVKSKEMKNSGNKILDNYNAYLKQPIRIGFMDSYPVKEVLDEITINSKCKNFDVSFKVKYCIFTFGKNNEHTIHGIITDNVSISHLLPLNGFGSHSFEYSAETMELGVIEMCKKHDLMICGDGGKICSYPFAKAITQPNFYKD